MDAKALLQRFWPWPVPIVLGLVAVPCLGIGFGFSVHPLQLIGVIAGVFGFVLTLDALGLTESSVLRLPDPTAVRVEKLTGALSEATALIAEIEKEVKARKALADQLGQDVERGRNLLKLNREEVEAVAQTFRAEVRREGRRSLLMSIVINAVFFGLGVLVTLILT